MCQAKSFLCSFFLLLVVELLPSSLVYSQVVDKKVTVWQSELNELKTIISNLETSNENKQLLLDETIKTSEDLKIKLTEALQIVVDLRMDSKESLKLSMQISQILQERDKYWMEYSIAVKKEISRLEFEVALWKTGTFMGAGVAVVAIIYAILPK